MGTSSRCSQDWKYFQHTHNSNARTHHLQKIILKKEGIKWKNKIYDGFFKLFHYLMKFEILFSLSSAKLVIFFFLKRLTILTILPRNSLMKFVINFCTCLSKFTFYLNDLLTKLTIFSSDRSSKFVINFWKFLTKFTIFSVTD